MKKIISFSVIIALGILPFTGHAQQKSSGIVDYQVTMQRNSSRMSSPNVTDDNNDDSDGSNVFTMNRNFSFNGKGGKLSSPDFAGRRQSSRRQSAQGDRGGRSFRGRSSNSEYVDFTNKKYIRAFKRGDNDTTFYIAQNFQSAENFQTSSRTKKIAGYTCHQATAQWHKNNYTIWYTKDIPITYSPLNGLIPPDGGFVLGLQSDRMEYKAAKVQLQNVADTTIQIQGPSHELTENEIQGMRKQMMDRRRGGRGKQ